MRRHISTSGTTQVPAKRALLEQIEKFVISMPTKDCVKFSISLQKHLSPGRTQLINNTRRHISTSGTAQILVKLARLEPMEKCFSMSGIQTICCGTDTKPSCRRDRAMLRVIEDSAKSLKITQDH